jgi:hypothetical protein
MHVLMKQESAVICVKRDGLKPRGAPICVTRAPMKPSRIPIHVMRARMNPRHDSLPSMRDRIEPIPVRIHSGGTRFYETSLHSPLGTELRGACT